MRVRFYNGKDQAILPGLLLLICSLFLLIAGCRRSSDEVSVTPPETRPLAREYIGYGVVNVSFTHLLSEPGEAGVSGAYLRRASVVRIIERCSLMNRGNSESWVLVEGNYEGTGGVTGAETTREWSDGAAGSRGWLAESTLDVFDNESQAITASRALNL